MGLTKRMRSILGPPALLASLLLASPGVTVRAEGPDPAEGASCEAANPRSTDAEVQLLLETIRLEQAQAAAAQEQAPMSSEGIVVLNGRGYNYGPPPGPSLDLIRAEAAAQRGQ